MFKHASEDFLKTLLDLFNEMVSAGQVGASWRETLFPMLPKTGDLASVHNWGAIAILKISYKLFSRLMYHRPRPMLD